MGRIIYPGILTTSRFASYGQLPCNNGEVEGHQACQVAGTDLNLSLHMNMPVPYSLLDALPMPVHDTHLRQKTTTEICRYNFVIDLEPEPDRLVAERESTYSPGEHSYYIGSQ